MSSPSANAPSHSAEPLRSERPASAFAPSDSPIIPFAESFLDAPINARPHDGTHLSPTATVLETPTAGAPLKPAVTELMAYRIAELEGQLAQRERQIAATHRASEAMFAHVSMDDTVRETLAIALEVTGGEAGSLQLHNPERDTLVFQYVTGIESQHLEGHAIPVSHGIGGRVFRTGIPDLTHCVRDNQEFNRSVDDATGFYTHSIMTVPVKRHDEPPIGVMQIAHSSQSFDERDLEVLSILCDMAASAIEQARLQNAARQVQLISLLGDISHDIKNMLTPLGTGASTLRWLLDESFKRIDHIQEGKDDPQRALSSVMDALRVVRGEYGWILGNAQDGAERVQARTREIADAIKGEITLPYFECAPISEVIYEVIRSLTTVANKASVRLKPDLDFSMPDVQHDRKMIYNALYNLVNNAISATPIEGIITLRAFAPDRNTACLEVADTGHGMPDHVRERLFTERAISTKPGGTGLGTRIVAGVVKGHNGTIAVQSEEGNGTTFTICFPLVHCQE